MPNRHKELRQKTFLQARITFSTGATTVDCLVRRIAESSAQLELSDAVVLPEMFNLYIPRRDKSYLAKLVARKGVVVEVAVADHAGSAFMHATPPEEPALTSALLLRRVSELEAENKMLRQMVMEQQAGAA